MAPVIGAVIGGAIYKYLIERFLPTDQFDTVSAKDLEPAA